MHNLQGQRYLKSEQALVYDRTLKTEVLQDLTGPIKFSQTGPVGTRLAIYIEALLKPSLSAH